MMAPEAKPAIAPTAITPASESCVPIAVVVPNALNVTPPHEPELNAWTSNPGA
ncbi:MAG: hypothetical protein IE918_09610 [Campylobacterales bacterium]|nr:hypothetical protein [Campylobacterales bacterium]